MWFLRSRGLGPHGAGRVGGHLRPGDAAMSYHVAVLLQGSPLAQPLRLGYHPPVTVTVAQGNGRRRLQVRDQDVG